MIYNDGQVPPLLRVYASAKREGDEYRALVRWVRKDSETQYLSDDVRYPTAVAAIERAHQTVMDETYGQIRLGPPKGNKASLSFPIIQENRQ